MTLHSFSVELAQPRLDKFLAQHLPELTRSYIQELIRQGRARVNASPSRAGQKLGLGDQVELEVPPPQPTTLVAEAIPLQVIYEDEDILVIDKPAGLTVHPAPGHPRGTLVNALLARYPALAVKGELRPGIVHRLDKDTSGLMVVAKNDAAQTSLSRQIKARSLTKGYLALVEGHLHPPQGAIEAPLGRDPFRRQRMAVVAQGREARTEYKMMRYLPRHTFLEVTPRTGRTHQIRVHLAAIGHPIYGDATYGRASPHLARHFLHAHRLGFRLPSDGRYQEFSSPLPPELAQALDREEASTEKRPRTSLTL